MLPDWIEKPNWMKNSSPPNGLQMSTLLLFSTIVLPLMLVGADMVTDVGVLGQMWPYTLWAKTLARRGSGNQAELNSTGAANSSSVDTDMDEIPLFFLIIVSFLIFIASTVGLLFSNPLATLLRNACTTVMMNSRELERKDVPVPLGNS